jgi:hypothetical protein
MARQVDQRKPLGRFLDNCEILVVLEQKVVASEAGQHALVNIGKPVDSHTQNLLAFKVAGHRGVGESDWLPVVTDAWAGAQHRHLRKSGVVQVLTLQRRSEA